MNQEFQKPPFWARILMLFERAFERLRIALEGAAEFLEWITGPAFGMLMRPFRSIMSSRVVELAEQAQGSIEQQSGNFWIRIRDGLATALPRLFPRRFFWPFYWCFEQLTWFFDFALAWFHTREFRKLIRALPAVAFSLPLIIALLVGRAYSNSEKVMHYTRAFQEAQEQNDEARAELLLARLRQLDNRNQEYAEFQQAIKLVEAGKLEEARQILDVLAPLNEANFAPAHAYVAAAFIDQVFPSENPWPLAERHARHALSKEPSYAVAERFLAECLLQQGNIEAALPIMDRLRKDFPEFNSELAHEYFRRGDFPVAKKFAKAAVHHWEKLQRQTESADVQITPQGYLRFAECFGILNNQPQELDLLRQGCNEFPQVAFLLKTYAAKLTLELPRMNFSDAQRIGQLDDLLWVDPENADGIQLLYTAIQQANPEALNLANRIIQAPRSSALLLKSVGDMYLTTDRFELARHAYELACQKDPQSAYAWNNLAWIHSNQQPIDLDLALQCAQKAIDAKNDSNFYETQGQILVKLERWEEAARSLEHALNGTIPNPQDAHRSLATIYTALGRTEQAAAHRVASGQ